MYNIYPSCGRITAGGIFMCTAITFESGDFYFGRNLDLSYHYNEAVTVTPRNYPFRFRNGETAKNHFAIIGMATVADGYPLYYDAANEKGVSMAGLNFPGNAVYYSKSDTEKNIAPFELMPYILSRCSTADEAYNEIERINLWNVPFSAEYPLTPLHWIVADKKRCFVVEPMQNGMRVHSNPVGVLTNNPPFDYHMHNLSSYLSLTPDEPENKMSAYGIKPYSLGTGALGLPGDMTSPSRFVRAAFAKLYAERGENDAESVNRFFHVLGFVEQIKGLNRVDGESQYTVYSSCCNAQKGLYYYKTYDGGSIICIDMNKADLNGEKISAYPLKNEKSFLQGN